MPPVLLGEARPSSPLAQARPCSRSPDKTIGGTNWPSCGPGRGAAMVTVALEKHLFLNVPRKRLVVTLCGKSLAISTKRSIRSESRAAGPMASGTFAKEHFARAASSQRIMSLVGAQQEDK